jgi:hypothetical protein
MGLFIYCRSASANGVDDANSSNGFSQTSDNNIGLKPQGKEFEFFHYPSAKA